MNGFGLEQFLLQLLICFNISGKTKKNLATLIILKNKFKNLKSLNKLNINLNPKWSNIDHFFINKELIDSNEEIRLKSLKTGTTERGIMDNNDILNDDLTIVGIGK